MNRTSIQGIIGTCHSLTAIPGFSMNSPYPSRASLILKKIGVTDLSKTSFIANSWTAGQGSAFPSRTPIDGSEIAQVHSVTKTQLISAIDAATASFTIWRDVPAPARGQLVRNLGEALRNFKLPLGELVAIESGKILQEGLGEVQEMIDICDFAVGISRQLYGLTMPSERAGHRLMEQWHPLGPIGVISAFNFPVAVWSWNAAIALVCGDPVIWKPSEKTPLTAIATMEIARQCLAGFPDAPAGLLQLVQGDRSIGTAMATSKHLPLISATGSTAMGRSVAQTVAARMGRSLLELGGNNAAIVAPSADLNLAVRGIAFSAVGTCGQRCTSLRRLIVHESVADDLVSRLKKAFQNVPIGDPLADGVLVGPLIDQSSFDNMQTALAEAKSSGGKITGGSRYTDGVPAGGFYVNPALVEIDPSAEVTHRETFAPIMYVMRYRNLDEAIAIQNAVPQGLSSSIFTMDAREAERFCSASGSDCGIANVNIGTSGAEIGGAFGGEKETGGGRESGSDAWKAYMRRATNTINYSTDLPLAQGIKFDI